MDELSSRLDAYEVSGAGFGWLVDENLTVIAHPNSEHILKMSLLNNVGIEDNVLYCHLLVHILKWHYIVCCFIIISLENQ